MLRHRSAQLSPARFGLVRLNTIQLYRVCRFILRVSHNYLCMQCNIQLNRTEIFGHISFLDATFLFLFVFVFVFSFYIWFCIVICLSFDVCALCVFNVRLIFNILGIYVDLLSPFCYNGQKFRRNNLTAAFILCASVCVCVFDENTRFSEGWTASTRIHIVTTWIWSFEVIVSIWIGVSIPSRLIFARHSFHYRYCVPMRLFEIRILFLFVFCCFIFLFFFSHCLFCR